MAMTQSPLLAPGRNDSLYGTSDGPTPPVTPNVGTSAAASSGIAAPASTTFKPTLRRPPRLNVVKNTYGSLENWESVSTIYQEHLLAREHQPRSAIWLFVFFVPVLVALVASVMRQSLEGIAELYVANIFRPLDDKLDSRAWLYVACALTYAALCLAWLLVSVALSRMFERDESIGRGLPAVIAHLNGIHVPYWGSWKVIVVKSLTTIATIAAGVPLGFFGILIETGAMIGAGILERTPFLMAMPLVQHFRNTRDRKLIVNIGIAAGVAAAFQSPIGGLLLTLELLSVKLPVKAAAYVFSGCIVCAVATQVLESNVSGFRVRDRDDDEHWVLDPVSEQLQVALDYTLMVPTIIIAILCGFVGSLVTYLSSLSIRAPHRFGTLRVLFVATGVLAVTNICLSAAFGGDQCHGAQVDLNGAVQADVAELPAYEIRSIAFGRRTRLFCPRGVANYTDGIPVNTYASLALTHMDSSFHLLMERGLSLNIGAMAAWGVVLFISLCYFAGIVGLVNGDTLLPGAALGAVVGHLVCDAAMALDVSPEWLNPGVCGLLGASAMLGSMTHLTYSLAFLMVDVSGDVRHITFVMAAVTIGRTISCHVFKLDSLEKTILLLQGYPLIEDIDAGLGEELTLHRFQTRLTCVQSVTTVEKLIRLVLHTSHNTFPVITRQGRFVGMLPRSTIELLLWRLTPVPPVHLRSHIEALLPQVDGRVMPTQSFQAPAPAPKRAVGISLLHPTESIAIHHPVAGDDAPPTLEEASRNMSQRSFDVLDAALENDDGFDEFSQLRALDDYLTIRRRSYGLQPTGAGSVNDATAVDVTVLLSAPTGEQSHKRPLPALADAIALMNPELRKVRINLGRYADRSPFVVRVSAAPARALQLFNALAARHLIILDYAARPVGILTRLDLMRDRFEARCGGNDFTNSEVDVPSESDIDGDSPVGSPQHAQQGKRPTGQQQPNLSDKANTSAKRRLRPVPAASDASGADASDAARFAPSTRRFDDAHPGLREVYTSQRVSDENFAMHSSAFSDPGSEESFQGPVISSSRVLVSTRQPRSPAANVYLSDKPKSARAPPRSPLVAPDSGALRDAVNQASTKASRLPSTKSRRDSRAADNATTVLRRALFLPDASTLNNSRANVSGQSRH